MTNNEIKRLRDMLAQLPQHGSGRAARIALDALPTLLDEVERLRCRNEVLWNALWKASGDHEPHVAANLESVGGNPADFLDDDMNGEHDDRQ